MKLRTQGLQTIDQLQAFPDGSQALDLEIDGRDATYRVVADTLRHFRYGHRARTAAHSGCPSCAR